MAIFRWEPPYRGFRLKKSRFSANISLYLRNDTRQPLSRYYSTSNNSKMVQDSYTYNSRPTVSCISIDPFVMTLNDSLPRFQGHTIIWCSVSHKRLKIWPWLVPNANWKRYPSFWMVPFSITWVTCNLVFKVVILFNFKYLKNGTG